MAHNYGFNRIDGTTEFLGTTYAVLPSLGAEKHSTPTNEQQFADTVDPNILALQHPEAGSIRAGLAVVGLAGSMIIAAAIYVKGQIPNLDLPDIPHPNTDPLPTKASFGTIVTLGEQQIGTAKVLTWGTGQIELAAEGKLDYNIPGYAWDGIPIPGAVEGTMFLEANAEHPAKLLYEPCLRTSSDAPIKDAIGSEILSERDKADAADAAPNPSEENVSEIKIFQTVDNTGLITGFRVEAGSLEPCHMRFSSELYDDAIAGESIFRIRDEMGEGQRRTFTGMSRFLLTRAAEAQACPNGIVDIEEVKADILTVATGVIAQLNGQLTGDQIANMTTITLDTSDVGRQARLQRYHDAVNEIKHVTETAKDSKGKTHELKPADFEIGEPSVLACTPAQEVTVDKIGS